MLKTLNILSIRIDSGTQSRVEMNEQTVSEYADAMKEGAEFPPLVVYHDGTEYYLADGFHRLIAAQRADKTSFPCEVIAGTLRDAILASLSANSSHGLRRTNADKRKAVLTILQDDEWLLTYTLREISKLCNVSYQLVANIKEELEKPVNIDKKKKDIKKKVQVLDSKKKKEYDESAEVIEELVKNNEELTQRLAVAVQPTEEERQSAQQLIDDLKEKVKLLTIECDALTKSRDAYQAENAELKKQVKMLQKQLKKGEA